MINSCSECFERQRQIDSLSEELERLKARLRIRERKQKEGAFGSSTPSSKIPIKANLPEIEIRKLGAKPGHQGNGRKKFDQADADQVVDVEAGQDRCPGCGGFLEDKGMDSRMVLDSRPVKAKKYSTACQSIIALIADAQCALPLPASCQRVFSATNLL